jgi:hypothetical protein
MATKHPIRRRQKMKITVNSYQPRTFLLQDLKEISKAAKPTRQNQIILQAANEYMDLCNKILNAEYHDTEFGPDDVMDIYQWIANNLSKVTTK